MRLVIGMLIITIFLIGIPGIQATSDDGLVAEWHFDEGSGNVLKDSSGNGNDGIIYGATWVDGKFGKALSFDGVDDYVDLASIPSQTYPLTIEMWVKPDNSTPIGLFDSASGQRNVIRNYHAGYVEWWNADPKVTLNLATDFWVHLTFIYWYDGNRHINYYKNGVLQTSATGSANSVLAWTTFRLGSINDGSAGWYDGQIDEVRIYNRALPAEDVKQQYESGPTALSVTKTASPESIKQGQTAIITLSVKNTGSTEISDIEIADTIPSYLTFIEGETSKIYDFLAPKDSRQISYTLQFNDVGTFNFEPAIATYADDKGNYNTVESKPASIEVIRSIVENSAPTPKSTSGNVNSASVNLHGEKTDVALGEDVLLKLSAVNIIGNPAMHVQVIIIPPSRWSVTSSEFAKSGAGQYTTTYELEPGGGKDIEVKIVPNQIGDEFQVDGRIIYYFGDDVETREDHTLSLPITVRAQADQTANNPQSTDTKSPGFAFITGFVGFVAAILLINTKLRF
ncbi:MAG: DUF11 domain-containing protein [Mariniphaga sp.]|nr:DUF11 domain-containing protein [Mariniphaga sp.]